MQTVSWRLSLVQISAVIATLMMIGVVVCAIQCVAALRTQNRIAYNESGFSMALATIGIAGCAAFATVCALIDFGRTRHVWRWWTYTFVLALLAYVAVRVAAGGIG